MITKTQANQNLATFYPYPVQARKLGTQGMVMLGGEVTNVYAIQIKKMLAIQTVVLGYSNDVMGYIPTVTILTEDGYERYSSQIVYGLPGKWSENIEKDILNCVK